MRKWCLNNIAYVEKSATWNYNKHKHDDLCEIMFITGGRGRYHVEHQDFDVAAGVIVIAKPGVVHAERAYEEDPISMWICSFEMDSIDEDCGFELLKPEYAPVIYSKNEIQLFDLCCRQIKQELCEKQEDFCNLIDNLLSIILLKLKRLSILEEACQTGDNLAYEVKRFIDERYIEKITLNEIAQQFHVSVYYLSHQMKKNAGISPINYLIARRLGESQKLLADSNDTIAEIAKQVGYEDVNYFSRLFQKRIGMSPGAFRRMYQDENGKNSIYICASRT